MAVSSITVSPDPIWRGENAVFTINHDRDEPSWNAGSVGRIFLYRSSGNDQIRSESFIDFTSVSLRQFRFMLAIPADTNRIIFWDLGRRSFRSFIDPPPQITFNAPSRYSVREGRALRIDSTTFFTGHTSLSFRSGTTPPNWVSISGTDIVITRAPEVTVDRDFNIQLTAANIGRTLNATIMIRVTDYVPLPFSIEAIDEQFITIGTEDYDLVIDIGGEPDEVEVTGDMEGFGQDWDAANSQLHIIAREAIRLVSMAEWRIKLTRGTETLSRTIIYNVVPAVPVITNPGNLVFYRGISDKDVGDGNYQFIEIANEPSVVRVTSDLTGLVATPGANRHNEAEIGATIEGDIDPNVTFSKSNLTADIFASNDAGEDTISDVPVLIGGPNPPSNVAFTSDSEGLHVTWDPSTIGTPILETRIRIDKGIWETTTGTSHNFTDVENMTEYLVELQSRNAVGYSPIVSITATHDFIDRATCVITFPTQTVGLGNGGTIIVTLTFNRIVTLSLNNISASGGAVLSNFQNVNGRVYRVTARAPATGIGVFSVSLIQDAIPGGNVAAGSRGIWYAPAGVPAVIEMISVGGVRVRNGVAQVRIGSNTNSSIYINVDRFVSGFEISDIVVTDADTGFDTRSWSLLRLSSSLYRVINLVFDGGTSGSATVSIARNVMLPGNNANSIRIDWGPNF